MSYSRSFRKTIAVHYSGSVSYPASEHGGTTSYSGVEYEDVTITVHVDTDPFDSSVGECRNDVNALTTSVVATEAAQIASIRDNAQRVGQTIVSGFFNTVSYDIKNQIVELSTRIDASILHLREMAKRCKDKQRQMQEDYGRICSRYLNIFNNLDKELENRIFEICRPAFIFKRTTDNNAERTICDGLVGGATVSGTESSILESRIATSHTKQRAVEAIENANRFLAKQKHTEEVLQSSIIDENVESRIYLPVCYLETRDKDITNRSSFKPSLLNDVSDSYLQEAIAASNLKNSLSTDSEIIRESFNQEVSTHFTSTDTHDQRVRDYVNRLFNQNINQ